MSMEEALERISDGCWLPDAVKMSWDPVPKQGRMEFLAVKLGMVVVELGRS